MTPLYLAILAACLGQLVRGGRSSIPARALTALTWSYLLLPNVAPVYPAVMLGLLTWPALVSGLRPEALRRPLQIVLGVLAAHVLGTSMGILRGTTDAGHLLNGSLRLLEAGTIALWSAVVMHSNGLDYYRKVIQRAFVLPIALGLIQLVVGEFLLPTDYLYLDRFAFLGHPDANYSALYLLIPLCSGIAARRFCLTPSSLVGAICWISLLLTLSRSALLAAAIAWLVSGRIVGTRRRATNRVHLGQQSRAVRVIAGSVSAVAIVATLSAASDRLVDALERIQTANERRLSGEVDTVGLRTELWTDIVEKVSVADLALGRGDFDQVEWNRQITGKEISLHNLLLSQSITLGLFGLALALLWILLRLVAPALRARSESQVLGLLLLAAYALHTLTISDEIGLVFLSALLLITLEETAHEPLVWATSFEGRPAK